MTKNKIEKTESTPREKLAALEAEREKLQTAHSSTRKVIARHEREMVTAEGNLSVATATAADGGWVDRRELRKAERAVSDVRAKLDTARAQAKEVEGGLDPIEEQILELRIGAVAPEIRAARKKAAELKTLLRQQQEAVLATARQAVALYQAAAAKVPRRLVSMRSEKFLQVEITNPAFVAMMTGGEDETGKARATSAFIHFEFFKARDGEKRGRWKIVPGQSMDPGKIERIFQDGPMPDEIESIRDLELGRLARVNGKPPTDLEKTDLDFDFLERMVTEEELQKAMQSIEEGV
jgi:chromosome segregation ATPase